ncbi:MAG: ATP-binding protein [Coxiellaceae bacterium]|nr:ATP-binding protein [Coxiellaceae bacterium]
MSIKREMSGELLSMASSYPVVTVVGPRQSGKTTLVKACFPDLPYVNLESIDKQQAALEDPQGMIEAYAETGAIFDEIQNVPQLLSCIQVVVDAQDKKGQFILTGSHQLDLHQAITQSLAGRTALLSLLPLTIAETKQLGEVFSLDEYILQGFYPRIYRDKLNPTKMYRQYVQTYVERDVRKIINIKDLQQFQVFIRLCAARVGQMINYSNIANEMGVSYHTVKQWLSVLEATFIIYRLPPYYANINKQLVKSPKLYFYDVGLATYLMKLEDIDQVFHNAAHGALMENLCINELIKTRLNKGLDPNLFYYRDSQGCEVDVLYQQGDKLIPIEIKAGKTYQQRFSKGIDKLREYLGDKLGQGYVVYAGEHEQNIRLNQLINFERVSEIVA